MLENSNSSTADKLEQFQKQFTKIFNQAMHDIQSPLVCLHIMSTCHKPEQSEKYILIANEVVDKINRIIKKIPQDLQDYIDANNASRHQKIIISKKVEKILSEKQIEYSNSSVAFQYHCAQNDADAAIMANPDDIERMLSNLLNNAVESCGSEFCKIEVNIHSDSQFVYLVVADNGVGMPDEVKEKILNNIVVTSGKANGKGIGFEQIRQIIANCNGRLNIESRDGGGTIIILTFSKLIAFVQ